MILRRNNNIMKKSRVIKYGKNLKKLFFSTIQKIQCIARVAWLA